MSKAPSPKGDQIRALRVRAAEAEERMSAKAVAAREKRENRKAAKKALRK